MMKALIPIIVLIFNILIIIFPSQTVAAAKDGILLWYRAALPSLFPFAAGISLLINLNFIKYVSKAAAPIGKYAFNISPAGFFVFVTGLTSGYPLGIAALTQMYSSGSITKKEALRLSAFCSNSGPLFILGSLGTVMLKNKQAALTILLCHYLSACITGIITGIAAPAVKPVPLRNVQKTMPFGKALSSAVSSACTAMINVGGFIIIFSVINRLISPLMLSSLISPLLEMTNGCALICQTNSVLTLPLLCAVVSFGGLSVYAQSAGFLSSCGLSSVPYLAGKTACAIISFLLCLFYLFVKNIFLP